jgi:hypothetical protein
MTHGITTGSGIGNLVNGNNWTKNIWSVPTINASGDAFTHFALLWGILSFGSKAGWGEFNLKLWM